jgi:Acyclic terpene utilisation family protein AtuA
MKQQIRIGCGAGFSGDRLEPAVVLAEKGELNYLVLECLAERTIALAQKRKIQDPTKGYDPFLERRIELLLPILVKNKVRLITNMGAANPIAAAEKIVEIARKQGVKIKVAAVTGDEVNDELRLTNDDFAVFGNESFAYDLMVNRQSKIDNQKLISANAYLGVEGILDALKSDANIIITGRVADPSLFLAPMIHEFGWSVDDCDLMAKGTVVGHLLECAGQITGGYFADPVKKPVPDLDTLGHPFADVFADGSAIISKVEGTGGMVTLATAKEQLLYEVVNPYAYLTPDVSADFTTVHLAQVGENQVKVWGATGKEKPSTLKVSVGYRAGFLGEGEISYAGRNALTRAQLAGEIIEKRLKAEFPELRIDYVGVSAIHRTDFERNIEPYEVRLRVAANAPTAAKAALIGEEVEALYTNGPAGGGGARKYVTEVVGIVSVLVDRQGATPKVSLFES